VSWCLPSTGQRVWKALGLKSVRMVQVTCLSVDRSPTLLRGVVEGSGGTWAG